MDKVTIHCPRCATPHEVDATLLGSQGQCRPCGATFAMLAAEPLIDFDAPAEWRPGDRIAGLYEVKAVLGEGGMGKVYRVHHQGWDLDLAVKSPRPHLLQNAAAIAGFEREAQTWVNLGLHPHIVSCYYVRRIDGIPRVFAELVDGGDLAGWIHTRKLYVGGTDAAIARILDIAIQIAWGLDYAHKQGLIHHDVKPGNVLLTADGTAKVTDFGLARARAMASADQGPPEAALLPAPGKGITSSNGEMTPAYCSPEQARRRPLARTTDIWSWAVSVLEMFTGEVSWFAGPVAGAALDAFVRQSRGQGTQPRMPPGLPALLQRCLELKPERRPSDLGEAAERLRDLYAERIGSPHPRPVPRAAELRADALNNRAISQLDLNRRGEAEALLDQALTADPHHAEASYNRGLLQWRAGRMTDDTLVRQLAKPPASHPEDWLQHYWLGLVHLERADAEAAATAFTAAGHQPHAGPQIAPALALAESGHGVWAGCLATLDCKSGWYAQTLLLTPDGWTALFDAELAIEVWDLNAGRRSRVLAGHDTPISRLALSADGTSVLSGAQDGTLKWWDVAAGRCLRTLTGPRAAIRQLAVSPDGTHGLSLAVDAELAQPVLRLWNLAGGQCVETIPLQASPDLRGFTLAPDCRRAGWADGQQIQIWDLTANRGVATIRAADPLQSLAIDWARQRAVGASDRGVLRIWELATGDCVGECAAPAHKMESLVLTADGRRAVTGGADGTLRLWDLVAGRCLRTASAGEGVLVAVDRDGLRALTRSRSGTGCMLRIWTLRAVGDHPAPFMLSRPRDAAAVSEQVARVRQAVDEARMLLDNGAPAEALVRLTAAREEPGHERDREVLDVWHAIGRFGRRTAWRGAWQVRQVTVGNRRGPVPNAAISPDGRWAVSGSDDDNELRLSDLSTGAPVRTLRPSDESQRLSSVAISPEGRTVIAACRNGDLLQWELATGRHLRTLRCRPRVPARVGLSFTPDGRRLLVAIGTELYLWDLPTGRCVFVRVNTFSKQAMRASDLGPDGRWALTVDSDTLLLWDLIAGRIERRLQGHAAPVMSLCISPDGRTGLSGSADHTVRVWDLATGHRLRTLTGHTDRVLAVAYSPDGLWAFSAGTDRTIRIWELVTGRCLRVIEGHTDVIRSLALTADGRWLLTCSADETLSLWELDWDYEVPSPTDWDAGARVYLQQFVSRQLLRHPGAPLWWDPPMFQGLLTDLQHRGYGWLRPDGVRRVLEEMAENPISPQPS
jgi:WD40 repeat protein/serine/threonine protein kinase